MHGSHPLHFPGLPLDPIASSALIQTWHDLAMAPPACGFRVAALAALQQRLAFDSALWGLQALRPESPGVLQGDLYRLPPEFTADWWRIADVDALAQRVLDRPGETVLDLGDEDADADYEAFDMRYGLDSALATCQSAGRQDLLTFVSLYRGPHGPRFDEDDRAVVQQLMPHLHQADRVYWRLVAQRSQGVAQEHAARLDARGFLMQASTEFCSALLDEFPHWSGGSMPAPLAALARDKAGHWLGRRVEVRAIELDDGLCGLSLQARIGRGLTRREETVARAYAAGLSYKEIARRHALAPATVRGYLRSCYLKLGVSNKAALTAAIQRVSDAP